MADKFPPKRGRPSAEEIKRRRMIDGEVFLDSEDNMIDPSRITPAPEVAIPLGPELKTVTIEVKLAPPPDGYCSNMLSGRLTANEAQTLARMRIANAGKPILEGGRVATESSMDVVRALLHCIHTAKEV